MLALMGRFIRIIGRFWKYRSYSINNFTFLGLIIDTRRVERDWKRKYPQSTIRVSPRF